MIITIGRQLGSGGLEIGRLLAEQLNLAFYDKELLTEAARHSGICPECFQQVDEQAKRTFGGVGIFGMRFPFVGDGNTSYNSMISGDNLFLIQSETIVKLAENEQGAVFVGRCADYVLRHRDDVVSVFITANEADRVKRLCDRRGCTEVEARDMMKKVDKQRSAYYDYYASREWGVASSYDICLNSSLLGIEGTVEAIINIVRGK
jgi:cytidylate kinase